MKYYLFLLVTIISCRSQPEDVIKIAAASSLQYPLQDIVEAFEEEYGHPWELITTSSGKLSAQIVEGAPYDIFYAANPDYIKSIVDSDRGYDALEICTGPVVLWSADDKIELTLNSLTDLAVNKIALPNPKIAPYGEAAIQVIENSGLLDKISDKLVFGESVSQTNQFIITKAVQVGFTSKSVVLSEQVKDVGKWIELDTSLYDAIRISRVFLGDRESDDVISKFDAFVRTGTGKEIMERYGFQMSN